MTPRPRVRHSIALLAVAINLICYTDRICIAIAGPEIQREFGLSQSQMGLVFSIFSLSYFLGQTPWGALADRRGARGLVSMAVAGWSIFTVLTAAVWNFFSLMIIRFTFGALEAALSPSVASAFRRWIPAHERSMAFGAFLGGGRLGAAITPVFATGLMTAYGWRAPFIVFGLIGILTAVAWYYWFRNTPREHPAITPAELEIIGDTPAAAAAQKTDWSSLLASTRLWCLLATAFGSTLLWQFYITWFPTYLRDRHHMSPSEAAFYAGIPFALGVVATWVGGFLTDYVGARIGIRRARTIIGAVSLASAALLMSAGVWYPQANVAALLMGCAAGGVDLFLSSAWTSAIDIGGSSGGAVAGMMNAASNAAGFASPAIMGYVLQATGQLDSVLLSAAAATAISAFFWLFVNPREKASETSR